MARVDLESIVTAVVAVIQAKLPGKLAAISAEKNDGITMQVPDNAAYFLQSLNLKEVAYDPYVWIGAVDAQSVPGRGAIGKIYDIRVFIVAADQGTDGNLMNRMFRYLRALEEVVTENFAAARSDIRMDLESIVPAPLTDLDSEREFKVTGVQMKIAIA